MLDHHKKRFLTTEDVAAAYGLSPGHLANLRYKGMGPRFYRVGRKILYDEVDVEKWVRACPVLTKDSI